MPENPLLIARTQEAMGMLLKREGRFGEAQEYLTKALVGYSGIEGVETRDLKLALAETLAELG